MKSIGEIGEMMEPNGKLIKKYICEECAEEVERKEMIIPIGPMKGEKIITDFGCKCADIELARATIARREALRGEKMKDLFNYYSLLNQSLQEATLENYEPTSEKLKQAKDQVETYIKEFDGKRSLMLVGDYGTGKSHLSVAITKELMKQGKECLFLSLPKLFTKIRSTYDNNGVTENELLEVIRRADLIVLDDLGAEHATSWAISKLFEVIDDRAGKATIYTTNLTSAELRERFNERNFSRLSDNTEPIILKGADYRRRNTE